MAFKSNEIKTGIMIFVTLAIFLLFLIAIFGVNIGKETKSYRVYLSYVGGITEGSLVKFRGMDVGQVSEVNLGDSVDTRIALVVEVAENTPVMTDSRAFLTSIGMMANQHIEIAPGSPGGTPLPPGEIIPSKETVNFAQIAEIMGQLNVQLQQIVQRVNDLFNEQNRTNFASMMNNMNDMLEEGRQPFLETAENLEKFSNQLELMSADIQQTLERNRGNIDSILANLQGSTAAANTLIKDLRVTVVGLERMMTTNNANISEMVENFQSTSQNLQEFTRILKEQPWLLVRKSAPPERKLP